ncbi:MULTISPECIES: cytochrome b/b6 domain-containing protein [Pseudomonadati]|uniref:cytochrome b/b6 domain-containing protein n=1 Tax=unclassified Halobacteriovorax TaxID=2639665 RepID=UPI000CD305F6|nr:cytochrome b/b6 domain-containing protein [Halobacteriovorax sp. DA5]POB13575.1 hypothetical protein C0Z22_10450 [Halobacteriovorax sp. DA5]
MGEIRLPLIFRVLHWGVAIAVILNAFILEEGKQAHRYLGYIAVSFVLLRLLIHKKNPITHYNPKAKYVYWLMWTAIIGLATTGFLMGLDRFFGNDLLEDIHEVFSNILIFLSLLHLGGVFFDAYKMKRRTWMVMISGEKE